MTTDKYSKRELLLWLNQHCDGIGDCDECHKDEKPLWEYPLSEGRFMLCRDCFRKAVEAHYA